MKRGDLEKMLQPDSGGEVRPELARAIASRMESDLKKVRPLASTPVLVAIFALFFGALAALGMLHYGTDGFASMGWPMRLLAFGSLAAAAFTLAFALAQEMAPGGRRVAPAWMLAAGILLGLAGVFAAFATYRPEEYFWAGVRGCLSTGLESGAIAGLGLWFLARRGAILNPAAVGVLTGLFGGVLGTTLLELQCSDFNIGHQIVAHWAPTLVYAGVGWLAAAISRR
jgi:hypothetical protein